MSFKIKGHSTEFLMGVAKVEQLNEWMAKNPDAIGVAIVGRSNVGKSSMINSIFENKAARVSKTPGRTREINIFKFKLQKDKVDFPHPTLFLIDLPGYGHAEVSKEMSKNWDQLMGSFFVNLSPHILIINIQDARHPDQASDREFYGFIKNTNSEVALFFNKMDKLKTQKERAALNKEIPALSKKYKHIRKMYFVSAETKDGLEPAVDFLIQYLAEQIEIKNQS
jgi:GTP-binding protein